jgi:hypothetical protein
MARTDFHLTLRPLPNVDRVRAMRAALKALLRRYGLRAVKVEESDASVGVKKLAKNGKKLATRELSIREWFTEFPDRV